MGIGDASFEKGLSDEVLAPVQSPAQCIRRSPSPLSAVFACVGVANDEAFGLLQNQDITR
jgi:hypothetical protein